MSEHEEKTAEMRNDPDFAPLVEGLDNLGKLVETVRSLHRRTHAQQVMLLALAGLIAVVAVLGGLTWGVSRDNQKIARDSKEQSERLQEVVAAQRHVIRAQEDERTQSMVEACQTRNSANKTTRQQFRLTYQIIRRNSDSVENKAFVEVLIDRIPKPHEQDRDCNEDHKLNRRDYMQ